MLPNRRFTLSYVACSMCLALWLAGCANRPPDERQDAQTTPHATGDIPANGAAASAPAAAEALPGTGAPRETELPASVSAPTAQPPAPTPAVAGDGELESVVVGGASRASAERNVGSLDELLRRVEQGTTEDGAENERRVARIPSAVFSALRGAGTPREFALNGIAPGEEVWVIVKAHSGIDTVATADPALGTGALMATPLDANEITPSAIAQVPLPLEHTAVDAHIAGYIGTVDVTQRFTNPFASKIEAVYSFPLPEKAAVNEFVMTIGERKIRGILREREEAQEIYAQARAQGYQASLLTQHRPNVFEQKVANIEPGHRIDVNIRYVHTLSYEDGWYSFVFPTVVGPRYNPPGSADPVLAVPRSQFHPTDGAAVRYLAPNERSGHDISIAVEIEPGVAIEEIDASHRVRETRSQGNRMRVQLANEATLPNRDFVLRYRVAGDTIKSSLLTYVDPKTQQGYFTLMVYPPSALESLKRQPLELVFVLDCSGSMSGTPIKQAKDAVLAALRELRPDDTFQVIRFSNDSSQFGPAPVAATRENIRRAEAYVRALDGSGGTQMIEGVKAALEFPHDPSRLRFVTFLTDGFIGNESEILGAIHDRLGASRIFSFGVGSSVNRYLLERMAGVGRGAVAYLGPEDSGTEVMDYFFDRISHPALIDTTIDWNGMRVSDVYPSRMPDLFVGRVMLVTGKFNGEIREPTVNGRAAGERLRIVLPRASESAENAAIPAVWARLRIADLADRRSWEADPYGELADEIKRTALTHRLMSDYTAFVAVDASRTTEGSHGTTVYQAVPVPQGVRYETTVLE